MDQCLCETVLFSWRFPPWEKGVKRRRKLWRKSRGEKGHSWRIHPRFMNKTLTNSRHLAINPKRTESEGGWLGDDKFMIYSWRHSLSNFSLIMSPLSITGKSRNNDTFFLRRTWILEHGSGRHSVLGYFCAQTRKAGMAPKLAEFGARVRSKHSPSRCQSNILLPLFPLLLARLGEK